MKVEIITHKEALSKCSCGYQKKREMFEEFEYQKNGKIGYCNDIVGLDEVIEKLRSQPIQSYSHKRKMIVGSPITYARVWKLG